MGFLKLVIAGIISHFVYGFIKVIKNERGDFIKEKGQEIFQKSGGNEAERGITAAGAMTPEEEAQYQRSFQLGNTIEQLLKYQQGLGEAPTGYMDSTGQYLQQTGKVGQGLYDQVLKGIQDPDALYKSTLDPQLRLASDFINNQYNTRGLMGSGLNIEQMGRAGAELAVNEANARMTNRQNQILNASSLAGNIYGVQQQDINNMSNLYNQQQNVAQGQRARQAEYTAYPYQAQLGQAYGMQNALYNNAGKMFGSGVSASFAGMGASTGGSTMSGGTTGGGNSGVSGGSLGGGSSQPTYTQQGGQYGYIPQNNLGYGYGGGVGAYGGSNQNYGYGAGVGANYGTAGYSDIRLKKNIVKIGKLLSGLTLYKWEWKDDVKNIVKNSPIFGVIAQEVRKIIPNAVTKDSNGYLMVDYNMIY